jgi:polyisoprenoid-binding protein YceI
MEDHFNENYLESSKYPKAEFKGYITNITTVDFSKNGKYPVTVEGNLTIHGVTQKINGSGFITIYSGKPSINGTFKIKIKEYGISGLYIGDKIANEAEITVNCKYE